MKEYSLKVYLHYLDNKKIEVNLEKILPKFENAIASKLIEDYYFTTHWAHGPHIEYIFKSYNNREEIDEFYEDIRKVVENFDNEIDSHTSYKEETLNDLATMEAYQLSYLPIYPHKTVTLSNYQFVAPLEIQEIEIHKLYHKYFYRLRPQITRLLKVRNSQNRSEVILSNLAFILSFSNNILKKDAIPSFYLSFSSHYYSFASHPQASLAKGYIKSYEKIYNQNEEKFNNYIKSIIDSNKVSKKLMEIIYEFSKEIEEIYYSIPEKRRIEKAEKTIEFIKGSFSDKNIFHNKWINQPDIKDVLLSNNYNINRFIVNFVYILYPTLYISPNEKHLYGYILYKSLANYLEQEWKDGVAEGWKHLAWSDEEAQQYTNG